MNETRKNKRNAVGRTIIKYRFIIICLITVIICWYISTFWFQLMLIRGRSMEPAYHSGQIVVLNKYDREYAVGDVIAINCQGLDAVILKRISKIYGNRYYVLGDNREESVDSRDARVGLIDADDIIGKVIY